MVFVLAHLFFLKSHAQISVNIGPDTTFCKDLWDQPISYLGSNLIIENGVEPFIYIWDCTYLISTLTLRASFSLMILQFPIPILLLILQMQFGCNYF